jgi:predicted nucleic acid-binding protein
MTNWLLDTVTVSELRKMERADRQFLAWEKTLSGLDTWISAITLNEISYGIHLVGARDPKFATQLRDWYRNQLVKQFSQRLLIVDIAIAEAGAEIRAAHRLSVNTSLIAATAKVHGLTVATRNIDDFTPTGVLVLNPWERRKNEELDRSLTG